MSDEALRAILVAALAFVTTGGAVGWYRAVKGERRADRAEPVDLVARTFESQIAMSAHVVELQDRYAALSSDHMVTKGDAAEARATAGEAVRRAAHAESEVQRLRQSLRWVTDHIRPIIEWLDGGALPPPPKVPADLRAYLDGELDTAQRRRIRDL